MMMFDYGTKIMEFPLEDKNNPMDNQNNGAISGYPLQSPFGRISAAIRGARPFIP